MVEDKTYTLEEIAKNICDSHDECSEDCPGWKYCSKGCNGALHWLRNMVGTTT